VRSVGRAWDPEVIDQAIPHLPDWARNGHNDTGGEPPVELDPEAMAVWRGEKPKLKDTGEINRSSTLVKIGRVLYDAGVTRSAIVGALAERDEALGYRKYAGRADADTRYHEIVDELESNGRNVRVRVTFGGNGRREAPAFNLTDLGNAERLIHRHGARLRYCWLWSKWLAWDGKRWVKDDSGEVYRRAKETVASIYQEAAAADDERRKAIAKHAMRSEAGARIKEMVDLARSDVPVMPEELDADPDLLNVLNGTIDLRTGELREHRREDLITKLAPVEYDPGAQASAWAAFLERVLPSEELRGFVQRAVGYSATGDTSEQCIFINHGTGANGKSTFQEAAAAALGDYAMRTPTETLLARRSDGVPNDVARLKGARFVSASETEEGRRLAESRIKDLTGQDTISARFMRAEFFDFAPTHKLWLSTNHKPEIRGTDAAIWRRIRLIPWAVAIPPKEQDKKLAAKLRGELPGVLEWVVQGCLEWRRGGLRPPDAVRRATVEYRAEMDVLGAFLSECCMLGDDQDVAAAELYRAYSEWCRDTGEVPVKQRRFGGQLTERGTFERFRGGKDGGHRWRGLDLLTHWKSRICRDSDPTDVKVTMSGKKIGPRGVNRNLGSEGSEGSVRLSVEDVLQDLQREDSGPGKAFAAYLKMPSDERLEYLAKAVLHARKLGTAGWQSYRPAVLEAAARIEEGE
jgi:P4 family phage/plasmid primase-like protien